MNSEFDISSYLAEKHRPKVISLWTYDIVKPKIISSLKKTIKIYSYTGLSAFVLFGSWARRDLITGPTPYSDIDILAYSPLYLNGITISDIEERFFIKLDSQKITEKHKVWLDRTLSFEGVFENTLTLIQSGRYSITKSGYLLIT